MAHFRLLAVIMTALAAVVHAQAPAAGAPVPGAPAGVTAFVDVAVVPMDTERVLPGQTVLVEGGRITALGPASQVKVPAGAVRVDGRGKYLMPGLADMHTHLIMALRTNQDDADLERRMLFFVATGVTTIRNLDHQTPKKAGERILRLRARAAAGKIVSPQIYTSSAWRAYGAADNAKLEDIAPAVAAYKAAGYDFLKIYSWDKDAVFDSLMAATRRVGLPVVGHIPTGVSVRRALAAGMRSFEHNYGYFDKSPGGAKFEPEVTTEELATLTKNAGTWNCPTYFWWHPDRGRINKVLQDAGAGLLLGTDALSNDASYLPKVHEHLAALVQHAQLTPYQALVTGTRNVAQYFGTLDSTGAVAVGKRADLVLLAGNPLEDIKNTAQQAGVMLGGRWLSREELDRRMAEMKAAGAGR
jgi:imidazolonepropionase-like amidohydrolase